MWKPETNDTEKQRHARILSNSMRKAAILNRRITMFSNDIVKSLVFNEKEKTKILQELKFLKTS